MDFQKIINTIEEELSHKEVFGEVASYIPELAKVDPKKFGMYLYCRDKGKFQMGDSGDRFSIQSISKVFTLTMAMNMLGEDLWKRVHVEPSGDPFNSLPQLEYECGIPRNPFINAGALVIADILVSNLEDPKADLLKLVRKISNDPEVDYDPRIAASEKSTGFRNYALVYYMKALGNIKNDPEPILDFYFHQCSLAMSCKDLAHAFMIYANQGEMLETGESI
jgi:glutaminase